MKPHKFLDYLHVLFNVKNDAGLSRTLNVGPPMISKIRNGMSVSDSMLVKILCLRPDVHIVDLIRQINDF